MMRIQDERLCVAENDGRVFLHDQDGRPVAEMLARTEGRRKAHAVNFINCCEVERLARMVVASRRWKYQHIELRNDFMKAQKCMRPITVDNRSGIGQHQESCCQRIRQEEDIRRCINCQSAEHYHERVTNANRVYANAMSELSRFLDKNEIIHPNKMYANDNTMPTVASGN